jgi:chromosomal replication initiation ATPase DnaA
VADTLLLSLRDGQALIGLPNPQARKWMETRLAGKIRRTLASYLGGQKVTVQFVELVSPEITNGHVEKTPETGTEVARCINTQSGD